MDKNENGCATAPAARDTTKAPEKENTMGRVVIGLHHPASPRVERAERQLRAEVDRDIETNFSKHLRHNLDAMLNDVHKSDRQSVERRQAAIKIQEAIMWLGMDLKALNEQPA